MSLKEVLKLLFTAPEQAKQPTPPKDNTKKESSNPYDDDIGLDLMDLYMLDLIDF